MITSLSDENRAWYLSIMNAPVHGRKPLLFVLSFSVHNNLTLGERNSLISLISGIWRCAAEQGLVFGVKTLKLGVLFGLEL